MRTENLSTEEIFGIKILKILRGFYKKGISISALKIVVDKTKNSKILPLFHDDRNKSDQDLFSDLIDFFCLIKKEKISLEDLKKILKEYKIPTINLKDFSREERVSSYTHFGKELLDENKFPVKVNSFGKFEVRLEPGFIVSEEFISKMKKEGFFISNLDQFIEFGKEFPDAQKNFNIYTFDEIYIYKLWSVYGEGKRLTYSEKQEDISKSFVLFVKKNN